MRQDADVLVVVPVRDGAATLPALLDALLPQLRPSDALVVVDDGSTDGTAAALRARGLGHVVAPGPGRGPGAARNAGVRAQASRWVVCLDVDDLPGPGWLDALRAPTASARVVRSGAVLRGTDGERRVSPRPGLDGSFLAGTWAVRRDLWDAVGGYDERYGYAENSDLMLRLRRAGAAEGEVLVPGHRLTVLHDESPRERLDRHLLARQAAAELMLAEHRDGLAPQALVDARRIVAHSEVLRRRPVRAARAVLALATEAARGGVRPW